MANNPYAAIALKDDANPYAAIAIKDQPPAPPRSMLKNLQGAFDELATPPPFDVHHPISSGAQDFGAGVFGLLSPLMHPVQTGKTAVGLLGAGFGTPNAFTQEAEEGMIKPLIRNEGESGGQYASRLAGEGISALPSLAAPEMLRDLPIAAGDLREAALGDPNVAALKGLRVGRGSAKALPMIRDVEAARPFLKGAQSLEDLQSKIPAAKEEIWGPYQETVDSIGGKRVEGPDGPTTVRDLENERLQISANLRTLKQGGPEAIQLAAQKGMNQADLLAREKAVQSALDPHLEAAGIDPRLIRQNFGSVARVGSRVAGKSTLAEPNAPYGFGRMLNMRIDNPRSWFGEPAAGLRDLVAGRPWWSGKPTDINLREAFRTGGPKPDFRAPLSAMPWETPPHLLESDVAGNAPFGEELSPGGMNGIPERNPVRVTPPPNVRGLLPLNASEANFMRRYIEPEPKGIRTPPPVPQLALPASASEAEPQSFAIMRPKGAPGEITRVIPTRLERLQAQGQVLPPVSGLRGLLPAPEVPAPSPEPTTAHVYPAGSAFRGLPMETPVYPAGSAFRPKAVFDLEKYLEGLTPKGK
jgi:hypothetical protein